MSGKLSCSGSCMQVILMILNIIFLILGIAIMAIGIYIKVNPSMKEIFDYVGHSDEIGDGALKYFAIILIGGGVVTVLIALFGCAGAMWRSTCCLYLYSFILIILIVAEFVAAIMAAVYKSKLEDIYNDTLSKVFDETMTSKNQDAIDAFQSLEKVLGCCGVHGYTDYIKLNVTLSPYCNSTVSIMGCGEKIIDIFSGNLPIVGGVLGGIVALEILTLIAACVLAKAIRNSGDDDDEYLSSPKEYLSNVRRR